MRKTIKNGIGTTVQEMLESGFESSFTKKELKALGVKIPEVSININAKKEKIIQNHTFNSKHGS
jgi:putative transcriptional regulator